MDDNYFFCSFSCSVRGPLTCPIFIMLKCLANQCEMTQPGPGPDFSLCTQYQTPIFSVHATSITYKY